MSDKDSIAKIEVGLSVSGPFDYAIPPALRGLIRIGQRVRVLFNRRMMVGYVVGLQSTSSFDRLNHILSILDSGEPSVSPHFIKLGELISHHYGCSWGEAIEITLPRTLRKTNPVTIESRNKKTPAQIGQAVKTFVHDPSRDHYWEEIEQMCRSCFKRKQSIICLVPEAVGAQEVVDQFVKQFDKPYINLAARQTAKEELNTWKAIVQTGSHFVIGTRSAIFAPLENVGAIIVLDEENEAFKQEQSPYYRAVDVALVRSRMLGAQCLILSQAPTAEMWHKSKTKGWTVRSYDDECRSMFSKVDMSNYNPLKSSWISVPLQNKMDKTLSNDGSVLLFMNRVGYSTSTHCQLCGKFISCKRCSSQMVFMTSIQKLMCRHCGYTHEVPKSCPECRSQYVRTSGTGTERILENVNRFHSSYGVALIDKDTKKIPKNKRIIIATQAIMRYKSQLKFDLVGMIHLDSELNRMDFRAAQKTFSLMTVLRSMAKEEFLVQTKLLDNYCLKAMNKHKTLFEEFYTHELLLRKELDLPPSKKMISLRFWGAEEEKVLETAHTHAEFLQKHKQENTVIFDPSPETIVKLRDKYRYHIMCSADDHDALVSLCRKALKLSRRKRGVKVSMNVDP